MDASPIPSENLHYLSNMRPDIPHKLDLVPNPVETHSYSDQSEDFKWRHDAVMLLCSLYRAKKEQFVSGFIKKRDLWAEVASEMVTRGFPVNYIACEKKWHNLCATFRKLRECNRYISKKRKSWAFYETMEDILSPETASGHRSGDHVKCESPENSCHAPNAVGMIPMTVYSKSLWPMPYRPPGMSLNVDPTHADGRPRSCDQDITSMLTVTLEENNHSQSSVGNNNVHNHLPMSSPNCGDDFKWTHNSVMMLCSMYIARKDQFLSGTVKKRDLWSDIAQQMNQEGFPVTFTGCEKKWHNLIATYKKVILYNKKKTWPYLHIFQKIIEEQQGNRTYINAPEYDGPMAGNSSYNKDCSNDPMCVKMQNKEEMSLLPTDAPVLYSDNMNNSNDSMDDFKWTHDSVISLCTLYKERKDDFLSNSVRKRDLWTEVANEMNIQGYCVTWVHCEKKWYNLYATYKKVTDHNRKRVRIWSTWPYLQLFQDIFSKGDSDGRHITPTPMNHAYESESGASHEMCSSPSNSDRTCDIPQESMVDHNLPPSKRVCIEGPPMWFLEYCERQREHEEQRHLEAQQRHRELLDAVMRGNDAVKELSENIKMFLNKCL